jgi:hypothetical protein
MEAIVTAPTVDPEGMKGQDGIDSDNCQKNQ